MLDNVSFYFSVSGGFKSGGFIQRLTQPVTRIGADQLPTFNPEKVTAYEVGLKAELPEYGLRFALAAFYSDYSNIQVSANPPGQINTVTANAAKATIKGLEAEFTWIPVPELFIQGSAAYQDEKWRLTFGVNNVTDKAYLIAGDSNGTIGYALGVFSRPRNWYLTAEVKF